MPAKPVSILLLVATADEACRLAKPLRLSKQSDRQWQNQHITMIQIGVGSACYSIARHALQQYEAQHIILAGFSGGLDPSLATGDIIDAHSLLTSSKQWMLINSKAAEDQRIAGVDQAIVTPEAKQQLFETTTARAVDMESHHVARLARNNTGKLFSIIRVILDSANDSLPLATLSLLTPTGSLRLTVLLWKIITRPALIPQLLKLSKQADLAAQALAKALTQRFAQARPD